MPTCFLNDSHTYVDQHCDHCGIAVCKDCQKSLKREVGDRVCPACGERGF